MQSYRFDKNKSIVTRAKAWLKNIVDSLKEDK